MLLCGVLIDLSAYAFAIHQDKNFKILNIDEISMKHHHSGMMMESEDSYNHKDERLHKDGEEATTLTSPISDNEVSYYHYTK